MKNVLKNFFYFTRTERRGILLLCALILLVLGFTLCYDSFRDKFHQPTPEKRAVQTRMQQEYEAFMASLREVEATRPTRPHYPERPRHTYFSSESSTLHPFPFDPNTADSSDLRRLGLPGWMARNIVRYREKGGSFRRPEDFRRIYGLTEEQYNSLRPYIRITPKDTARPATSPIYLPRPATDTLPRSVKYPAGTVIELNGADTTELKKIPGIGSGIARLITGYRQRLGGFYSLEQLREINLNPEPLRSWLRIDTTAIRRLNLNRIGVDRLRRHPYFNFYQAKAIVEWRRKHGTLRSLKTFVLYEEFTKQDFERMQHYICFE